jgi:hypothetical protein
MVEAVGIEPLSERPVSHDSVATTWIGFDAETPVNPSCRNHLGHVSHFRGKSRNGLAAPSKWLFQRERQVLVGYSQAESMASATF